jgi:hypothetical protein
MTSWVLGPGCLKRITNVLSVITVHSREMRIQTFKNRQVLRGVVLGHFGRRRRAACFMLSSSGPPAVALKTARSPRNFGIASQAPHRILG